MFGRQVEEEEGALGLWLTYLVAGVGGAVASYLSSPHTRTISLGASGAVFGLFMVRTECLALGLAVLRFKQSQPAGPCWLHCSEPACAC